MLKNNKENLTQKEKYQKKNLRESEKKEMKDYPNTWGTITLRRFRESAAEHFNLLQNLI